MAASASSDSAPHDSPDKIDAYRALMDASGFGDLGIDGRGDPFGVVGGQPSS
jgi:hypothetical protein